MTIHFEAVVPFFHLKMQTVALTWIFGAWEVRCIVSVVKLVPTSVHLWVVSISNMVLTEL